MKILLSVCAAILTFFTLLFALPSGTEAEIYDNTLRLRVLANSNGDDDQQVKLLVRDAVIAYAEEHYSTLRTREEVLEAVARDQSRLIALAEEVLRAEGFSYGAELWVGEETADRRTYEDFALPAGEYLTLQIRLGEAGGENWWCVLFPPLCLGGALRETPEADCVPVGLSTDQYELITSGQGESGRYRIKFRLLELLEQVFRSED